MRVCIDGIVFENSHQRGIQRYFRGIVDDLPAGFEVELVMSRKPRAQVPAKAQSTFLSAAARALPRPWRDAAGARARRRREQAADIFHSSYYTCPESNTPAVLTVQDMIVEKFTDYFHSRWADDEVRRKRSSIEAASLLITGSMDTATDVRAFFPQFSDRIIPIHHGADHIPAAKEPRSSPSGEPYVLFVGDRGGYKNFRCVLEALGDSSWPRDLALVVIGPEPRENEKSLSARIGPDRVRFIGRVDDAALRSHYASAHATIVPSLAEGFGFPVLEGQRAACPVVCSDIGVFREIAADSALYFHPAHPEQLGAALARVRDSRLAAQLSERGLANSARFTWARAAQQTADVYRRAAECKR